LTHFTSNSMISISIMNTKRNQSQILRDHYLTLGKKFAAKAGIVAMALTMFASGPAFAAAGVLGSRSAKLDNSAGNAANVTATFLVTPGSAATIKGVKFSLCTSPLLSVSCTSPAGATLAAATAGSQLKNGGAIGFPYAAPTYTSTTDVCFTNATGNAFNGSTDTFTFPLQVIHLPTAINSEFYLREQTWSTADCTTTAVDFGGFAESTSQQLAVTASVQETITFCVGVTITTACTVVGSGAVPLTPNVMSTGAVSTATAKMSASTNATNGFIIQYLGSTFTDTTGDSIALAAATGTALGAPGTEIFGFNLVANSGGNFGTVGAAFTGGSGNITIDPDYATNNTIAYTTAGSGSATSNVATASGPTVMANFTMSYAANIGALTKPGSYTSTQTFIATGTF
jgi:hypothetical protein